MSNNLYIEITLSKKYNINNKYQNILICFWQNLKRSAWVIDSSISIHGYCQIRHLTLSE